MTLLMRDQENVKIGEEKMLLLIERQYYEIFRT